jgi:hypothetical protein
VRMRGALCVGRRGRNRLPLRPATRHHARGEGCARCCTPGPEHGRQQQQQQQWQRRQRQQQRQPRPGVVRPTPTLPRLGERTGRVAASCAPSSSSSSSSSGRPSSSTRPSPSPRPPPGPSSPLTSSRTRQPPGSPPGERPAPSGERRPARRSGEAESAWQAALGCEGPAEMQAEPGPARDRQGSVTGEARKAKTGAVA